MKLDDAKFEIQRGIYATAGFVNKPTEKSRLPLMAVPIHARQAHATQARASYVRHYGSNYGGGQRAYTLMRTL